MTQRLEEVPANRHQPLVVATGCPGSGWDAVLTFLENSNAPAMNHAFCQWHDDYYQRQGEVLPPVDFISAAPQNADPEAALSPLVLTDSRAVWFLDFWREKIPQSIFLLFYVPAEAAIARAAEQQVDIASFVSTWISVHQHLLQFQRRFRSNVLLFNAEAVLLQPGRFVEICRSKGLELNDASDVAPLDPECSEKRFLARYFVQEHGEMVALHHELTASAQPLDAPQMPHLSADALARLLSLQAAPDADLLASLKDIEAERDALKTQIRDYQEQLGNQQQLAAQKEALQQELRKVQTEQSEQADKYRQASEENELLLTQLHQVQEELEQVFLQKQEQLKNHQQLEADHTNLKTELSKVQEQFETVQKEKHGIDRNLQELKVREKDQKRYLALEKKYQQLGVELKSDREQYDRSQKELQDIKEENELLLMQLHQVQEELEQIFLQQQQQEQDNQRLRTDYNELKQQIQNTTHHLEETSAELERQQQRTRRLKKTASWKITAPMRAVSKPFKNSAKNNDPLAPYVERIRSSGLFDEQWYLNTYPDVAEAGVDPVRHYLEHGVQDGRNPSPTFNTLKYQESHPEIVQSEINPLLHYIQQNRSNAVK